MKEFPKKYNPKEFEESIYENWERSWKFKPQDSKTWDTFYIPTPPPNVTWILHIWHAIWWTLQDIMLRYHRMKWDSSLAIPGTDHAGIATQLKVEEKLSKDWKTKHNIPREDFLKECWDWNEEHWWIIQKQFRKLWVSFDWSKEKFTFDDSMNKRVNKAFVDLYDKWLIYRWEYMVNYDPVLNTVVSDQEVIYKEEKWKLYYITYFVSGSDNELTVATTRPETILWDVAVAVHPKDKRYKKLLKAWKKLILPILNIEIPIVADEMVDPDFGTGVVKITPAHDPNDFEVAKRHNLPMDRIVLWKDGKMTSEAGIFAGQDFMTARWNIVELLKSKWNLEKIEDYTHKVWYWERSNAKIETIISTQWFVKIEPIAKKVIAWYKKKDFEIIPKRFNKIFEDWIYNLRDWCISRQLIWWHQIPVWYWADGEVFCAETQQEAEKKALAHYWEEKKLTRDTDALDTWFSSALWPFSVLDYDIYWGEQSDLFKHFYPAQVLETWHDIIFFWVIRMLLFWYEFTWETPFKKIYFHWLVRDKIGRKMSKSLGNWVDPLDMIEAHGTDALRLSLSIWNTPWNDLKFDEENVINNKLFINKLWNATRFVYSNIENTSNFSDIESIEKELIDNYNDLLFHERWILSRISYLSELVTKSMEDFNFSESGQELQHFTKNEFCDYYIEEFKLTKDDSVFGDKLIIYVINNLLKLWHPYIPFISEELYHKLWFEWDLIDSSWSKVSIPRDKKIEKDKTLIIDVIKTIRNIRAENNVMPNKTIKLKIYAKNTNADLLNINKQIISGIVKSEETEIVEQKPSDDNYSFWVIKAWVEVYVDTSNSLDVEKETMRLKDQIEDTKEYIAILDKKLLNENFVRNAPEHLVRSEMDKKEQAKDKLKKLEEKLWKIS